MLPYIYWILGYKYSNEYGSKKMRRCQIFLRSTNPEGGLNWRTTFVEKVTEDMRERLFKVFRCKFNELNRMKFGDLGFLLKKAQEDVNRPTPNFD